MINPESGVTKPAAGVTATSPTTAPVAAPTAVGRPERLKSSATQVLNPAAPAANVEAKAVAAIPSAARAEPALKPNHPNQSRPAPSKVNGTLCGTKATRPNSRRGPIIRDAISAEVPALTCKTVPTAKSRSEGRRVGRDSG